MPPGRLPDPGLGAICARCNEPREAHGGPKHYGACPDQSGLRAARFRLQEADRPPLPDPPRERLPLPAGSHERPLADRLITAEVEGYIRTKLALAAAANPYLGDARSGYCAALDQVEHLHLSGVDYELVPKLVGLLRRAGLLAGRGDAS